MFPWPPWVTHLPTGRTVLLLTKPPTLSECKNACGLVVTMLFKITLMKT